MPLKVRLFTIIIFSLLSTACFSMGDVIKKQGTYPSLNNNCKAIIKASDKGGFLKLYITFKEGKSVHIADDVTGVVWINNKKLVFSSSPVYGKPGVFSVVCDNDSHKILTLVKPKNIIPAYPDGTDYFELKGYKGNRVEFYYGADVDKIDFSEFRTNKYLSSVLIP